MMTVGHWNGGSEAVVTGTYQYSGNVVVDAKSRM